MNAKAAELGLHDSHFVRPDGLDVPGEYSSAADVTKLARIVMRTRFVRDTVREQTDTIAGGRVLHTWDDLLSLFPRTIGVKTGHTERRGLVPGRGGARRAASRSTRRCSARRARSVRNADLESLLVWGISEFRVVPLVQRDRVYATVELPYGKAPLALRAAKPLIAVARLGRPLTERVVAAQAVSLPVREGQVLGRVEIWSGSRLVGHSGSRRFSHD